MTVPAPQSASLVRDFEAALPKILADIELLVRCESPSADLAAVARSADLVAEVGAAHLAAAPERIVLDGRTHLRWRLGDGPRRVLVVGHHDTVWPVGSLATHPFGVENGVLRGPGCFDMKTGVVMAFHALAALESTDGVTVLVTGDEELGSPSSRALIEAEARGCDAALVLEASADGGALKTERKGVSRYEVLLRGRAAHAGLEPHLGVNASVEAAHQILATAALGDAAAGTTVTPTVLDAGTTTNTVAAEGRFAVDVRVRDTAEQDRVDVAMRALRPVLDGARVEVVGGPNRPPMSRDASRDLFARAARIADGLGVGPLSAVAVGGASDGNFTAGVGTPTLDGLGAVGGGAHADHEHVEVAELPRRTALLTALLRELLDHAQRPHGKEDDTSD
ncbi:M20 family metallopeptidase [Streptomyces durmitorensis]|uniref:M20 family metallopeptidase n=1 Tax=Streptomyces durmitorensis TaxID=319947 RepID=A0ABY4Q1A0_9ACTN|nr:M20 family metallopeptidase [Streptomyces durmitorensis]UQT59948.1 M20 family metallopeptidase [Streptomyces durmitorensis]